MRDHLPFICPILLSNRENVLVLLVKKELHIPFYQLEIKALPYCKSSKHVQGNMSQDQSKEKKVVGKAKVSCIFVNKSKNVW